MKKTICLAFISVIASCGYNNTKLPITAGNNSGLGSGGTTGPDFVNVKAQFFQPHCMRCHSDAGGNRAGVNLETYANVSRFLSRAQSAVNAGSMPPAGPLSADRKSILNDWIAAGAPEFASISPGTGPVDSPPINPNPGLPEDDDCDDRFTDYNRNLEMQKHGDDCN